MAGGSDRSLSDWRASVRGVRSEYSPSRGFPRASQGIFRALEESFLPPGAFLFLKATKGATVVTSTRSRVSEGIDGKDAVGLYLEGIAKTPLLTAEEEVELAKTIELGLYAEHILSGDVTPAERGKRAKRPTPAELEFLVEEGKRAMQRFVTANLRLVVSVARKYGRSQMPLLDLVQEGNTGLIRAVEKFDYTKGFKFSTYGTWWVRQSISRGIAQQGRIVRLPVHVAEQVNQVGAVRRRWSGAWAAIRRSRRSPRRWICCRSGCLT